LGSSVQLCQALRAQRGDAQRTFLRIPTFANGLHAVALGAAQASCFVRCNVARAHVPSPPFQAKISASLKKRFDSSRKPIDTEEQRAAKVAAAAEKRRLAREKQAAKAAEAGDCVRVPACGLEDAIECAAFIFVWQV
jgi:hypothetical protein